MQFWASLLMRLAHILTDQGGHGYVLVQNTCLHNYANGKVVVRCLYAVLRKQVLSLSHGIAAKMLTYEQFYTIPDFVNTAADGDSRSCSNTNLATTTNFNASHANVRRGFHLTFHLSQILISSILSSRIKPIV
jgi:hypothetical protein